MGKLLARLRGAGFLLLIGICLIIYIALGFIYFQQGLKQKDLEEQIDKLNIVVSKPLPSAEELQAEYDEVNRFLSPLAAPAALNVIVGIARESGIDVDPDGGKFSILPPGKPVQRKVGEGSYQVLFFKNIKGRGDYDSVMAFISDLDSGKTLKTMVLKSVKINYIEVRYEGEEEARRTEFRNVSSAVIAMMTDNSITAIPNPINYAGDTAVNYMGDDPDTAETTEGFPDTTTTAADKDYSGTGTPKDGYVLYQHDKIDTSDNTTYTTVNYVSILKTEYYYTCEADGTVRQFGGPDVVAATEYLGSEETKTEAVAILEVELYAKPLEGD